MDRVQMAIKISADSVAELRRCDVFRVLDWAAVNIRDAVADHIRSHRPDLVAEVNECMAELVGG